jgi:hypothetical protein
VRGYVDDATEKSARTVSPVVKVAIGQKLGKPRKRML